MHLILFFTFDTSLKDWVSSGLLDREVMLYQKLIKSGVKITFITYGDGADLNYAGLVPDITILPVYHRKKYYKNIVFRILSSFSIPWVFRKELAEADIIKTNQIWGSWVFVLAKYFIRLPLIVRLGWEPYQNAVVSNRSLISRLFLYLNSWLAYKSADTVWCSSKKISDFILQRFNVNSSRIKIRENYIDLQSFKPKGLERYSDRVLYVGRLAPEKNIELLIDAISKSGFVLDIVGMGEYQDTLISKINDSSVRVNFLGTFPNAKLPEIYNKYQVYVISSKYEGNPKTLLEAMACGCAVIGTDVIGINSIISHYENGILAEETSENLASAIRLLMTDKELRQQLSAQAVDFVSSNSIENFTNEELGYYHSLFD